MSASILLLVHNIGFGISAVAGIGVALFLVINNRHSAANIAFALTFLAAVVFIVSHIIGVNVSDPSLSRFALMFNLSVFFIGAFNVHAVLAFLGKDKKLWYVIALLYATGLSLVVFFLIYPDLFLLPSVPKMYFPNYYNPGALNWIRLAFVSGVCLIYMLVKLGIAYHQSSGDARMRNQIKYFIIVLIGGYGAGFVPNFLVYNIPIDPLWGMAFIIFAAVPILYASLKYEFMDIKIIAKQALLYAVGIATMGGLIILFDYSNRLIASTYPGFPFWIIPLVSAVILVLAAGVVWRKLREGDLLKYEFINVVTHKFRTPLTSIKWSGENLIKSVPEPLKEDVRNVQVSAEHLVELTNLLVNLSSADDRSYEYRFSKVDIGNLLNDCVAGHAPAAAGKDITLVYTRKSDIVISADTQRIRFVIQTLLDNAMSYTPKGGTVTADISLAERRVVISVADTGIGISRNDIKRLFTKFYRADNGRKTDTEGMGIGLYLSKRIVETHEGKIWVESDGEGKGSVFYVSLPLGK